MKLEATTSISNLELRNLEVNLQKRFQRVQEPVHQAMAIQFRQCAYDNFGAVGSFRPHQWVLLSPRYAKKVKRNYATLNVSGALRARIKQTANPERGRVSISNADVPYATAHQYGVEDRNLPDRPYFPMHRDGSILRNVIDLVLKAARLALTTKLK